MSQEQRTTALELGDKLYAFAEAYNLPNEWVDKINAEIVLDALNKTGINPNAA